MLVESLKDTVARNKSITSLLYLRNLLKEHIQLYVLNFIYTSIYGERFLFKGGTCLRVCFGLPRLSEDLDFDIKNYAEFDLEQFETKLTNYFISTLQYKDLYLKRAKNQQQIYLKFPILETLGLRKDVSESPLLFVRIDVSPVDSDIYTEEISLKSTYNFNFLIKRYSLPDLFASKIAAILQRSFRKGKGDAITFKGRDYYDLIWFMEQRVKPNLERLKDMTGIRSKEKIVQELDAKVQALTPAYLKEDLLPFFADQKFIEDFAVNFKRLYLGSKEHLVE